MKKRLLMILLVVALLVTAAVFAVQADDEILVGTTITESTKCPCCGELLTAIEWTELAADTTVTVGNHYRAQGTEVVRDATLALHSSGKTVIYLDNATLKVSGTQRVIQTSTGSVYVIGNNGTLTGDGSNDTYGGFSTVGSGLLWLGGSLTVKRTDGSETASTSGGLFYHAGGTIVVDGATIYGDACTNGGISFMTSNTPVLTVKSGTLHGAAATNGGVVWAEKGTINIDGGIINGASATNGGAIYSISSNEVNISNGTINGASAAKGGAIYSTVSTTVSGGTINGAYASNRGGAICVEGGTLTVSGTAEIVGTPKTGTASKRGGAISFGGSTFNMIGGTIRDGYAENGGNIMQVGGTINIKGGTITGGKGTSGGNIDVWNGTTNVLDTSGTTIISNGTATNGGNIYVNYDATNNGLGACAIELARATSKIDGGSATRGGSIWSAYSLTINKGTISGGSATYGGAIYINTGNTNVAGGSITAASGATDGGVVYAHSGNLKMSGGTITGTTVTGKGGAVYAKKTVQISSGAAISGGTSEAEGGAIYMESGTLTVAGTVSGGTAGTQGGAIYMKAGTLNVSGTVSGGTATTKGGNIYLAGGTDHVISGTVKDGTAETAGNIQANVDLSLSGATVSGGKTTGVGGQMVIAAGATVTMSGSALIDGSVRNGQAFAEVNAGDRGGAIYMDGSTFDMQGGTIKGCASSVHGGVAAVMNSSTFQMSGDAEVILDSRTSLNHVAGIFTYNSTVNLSGSASIQGLGNEHSGSQGNALSLNGTPLTLSGNASVYDAGNTCRKNIVANSGLVTISEGWNGKASIYFPAAAFTGGTVPGATIGTSYAAVTTFTGKLYAENVYVAAKDLTPQVLANNGQLQVAATYIQDAPTFDGITWYLNNAAAVAAYEEGDVIRLITTESLDLAGKELYVDFGGLSVDVTANGGKLYGIDTATVGTADAVATATGVTPEPFAVDPLVGTIYVAKEGHFYPIQVKNDGYGVRSADMGIYFNALIQCNPAIQNCIVGYGIDATLDDSFGADNYLTGSVNDSYPAGGAFYGYISGIMGAGVGNDADTGVAPIRTRLWIKLSNGEAEYTVCAADRTKSFKDVMQAINTGWTSLTESHETVLDMYKNYYSVMSTWGLTTIDDAYEALN